jgi:hypothetical protein
MREDLALALDPALLMRRCGYTPDTWQAQLLRSPARQIILCCSRQSGKSTATAAAALHTALYRPKSLTLLLSPSLRQSQETFRKVTEMYSRLGSVVRPDQESALRLELENQSRIISLPGVSETIRGYSGVTLLIIEEAAFLEDTVYESAVPMMATSRGKVILLSTPRGRSGFFFHTWNTGGNGWERIKVTAPECPRIPAEFLKQQRLENPAFLSEYMCEFISPDAALFDPVMVERALSDEVQPLRDAGDGISQYYVGLDLGQAVDPSAIAVIERVPAAQGGCYDVRDLFRFPRGTPYPEIIDHVQALINTPPLWAHTPVIVDATGLGMPVIDMLRSAGVPAEAVLLHGGESVTVGTGGTGMHRFPKTWLATLTRGLLESRRLRIAKQLGEARRLVSELCTFTTVIKRTGALTVEAGRDEGHADLAIAMMLACAYAEQMLGTPVFGRQFDPRLHVAAAQIMPESGRPIVRGWNLVYPACVMAQRDREGGIHVLFEHPWSPDLGLDALREQVLQASGLLFPGKAFIDIAMPDGFVKDATGRTLANRLRPDVIPQQAQKTPVEWIEVARQRMSTMRDGKPLFEVDPRCVQLILALGGGLVYRRRRGAAAAEVEDNLHSRLALALLCTLASPQVILTDATIRLWKGPSVLIPT